MSSFVRDAPDRGGAVVAESTEALCEATATTERTVPRRFASTRARIRKFVRREHPPADLRHMLTKAVLTSITVPVCFVGTIALCWVLGVPMSMHPSDRPQPVTPSSEADDAVRSLVERHGCWMGAAPPDMAGKDPGHAVVTWPGRDLPTYGGDRAVAAALDHVFVDRRPEFKVHAFCR